MGENYLGFAVKTAREAGDLLMRNYGKMQKLEWKLKTNFKTQVDDESDDLIRQRIQSRFPEHSIYSEENKDKIGKRNFGWIVDPLDGTISYTYGLCDHFSVCISLAKERELILGVIYAPLRKELYFAEKRNGAFCNNERIKVMSEDNLNKAIIGFGSGKDTPQFKRTDITKFIFKLYDVEGITHSIDTACASIPLALVASGKLSGCFYPNLEPWDMAAAVIINREAGAKVTSFQGSEWQLGDSSIVAANPVLHKKLMDLLHRE